MKSALLVSTLFVTLLSACNRETTVSEVQTEKRSPIIELTTKQKEGAEGSSVALVVHIRNAGTSPIVIDGRALENRRFILIHSGPRNEYVGKLPLHPAPFEPDDGLKIEGGQTFQWEISLESILPEPLSVLSPVKVQCFYNPRAFDNFDEGAGGKPGDYVNEQLYSNEIEVGGLRR